MLRSRLIVWTLALLCTSTSSLTRVDRAQAQVSQPLRIEASQERMRVDGALNEWKGARFVELGSGDDASLRYALADADGGLYLGVEVRDERLVTGDKGDALVLSLAMPEANSSRWLTTQVWLYPGEAGKSRAHARLLDEGQERAEPALKVVEGPRKQGAGYVVEAFIPWAAIEGGQIWAQGRGSLRFLDVDGQGVETALTSGPGTGYALPQLAVGTAEQDMLGSFMIAQKLEGVTPRYDFRSDVSGDRTAERVVLVDRFVVVYGPGYKRGESFNFFALPYGAGGGLKDAALIDLTGDGRAELVVTVHQQNALGKRTAWLVLSLDHESMSQQFGVELRKETQAGFVEASLRLLPAKAGSKVRRIELASGRAQGLDPSTYVESPATDMEPILLPWGDVTARRYGYDGQHFAMLEETRSKSAKAAVAPADSAPSASKPLAAPPGAAHADAQEGGVEPLLALFKTQQKLPASQKPTRTLQANVLSGSAPERIDVFGGVLVFTGPDVGGGLSYLTYTLPMTAAQDLLELRAADVTADRGDELLVRIRGPLGGAAGVLRDLLLVLRGDEAGRLGRALLVEVARRQGEAAIENRVLTQNGSLVIEPGTMRGWTQVSYPFSSARTAGVEPLLLPWQDRSVRYHREGALLVPVR